jgi:hypothetical protein
METTLKKPNGLELIQEVKEQFEKLKQSMKAKDQIIVEGILKRINGLELIQALKEQIEILKQTLKDKDEIIELLDKLKEKELSNKPE